MNINIKTNLTGTDKHKCRRLAALALAGVLGSLGMANTAQADTIYQTGFENPPFLPGQLVGQQGWVVGIGNAGTDDNPNFISLNPEAGKVVGGVRKDGKQSFQVKGADMYSTALLTGGDSGNPLFDAVGSYRKPLDYTVKANKPLIRMQSDIMLITKQRPTPKKFFCANIAMRLTDDDGNPGVTAGESGLCSNGVVTGATPSNGPPSRVDAFEVGGVRFNKWYHLTVEMDFIKRTTTYLMNDHLLGVYPIPGASNILLRGGMVVYATFDGDDLAGVGNSRANYAVRVDNFRISERGYKVLED